MSATTIERRAWNNAIAAAVAELEDRARDWQETARRGSARDADTMAHAYREAAGHVAALRRRT